MLRKAIVDGNWAAAHARLPEITDPNRLLPDYDSMLEDPDNPLLHYAISRANHPEARALVTRLLAIDETDPDVPQFRGRTALHVAINFRHPGIARELLAHPKTSPNATSAFLQTPLHRATMPMMLNVEMLSVLLEDDRVNPNLPDKDGNAPLHHVARDIGWHEIKDIRKAVALLIARGANPFQKNHEGKTPIMIWDEETRAPGYKAPAYMNLIAEIVGERRWCRLRRIAASHRGPSL